MQTRIHLAALAAVASAFACGGEYEPEAEPPSDLAIETSEEALYGTQHYESDCPSYLISFSAEGVRRGRISSASRAFEQCIEGAVGGLVEAWDGNIGPYRNCSGDPWWGTGEANQTDRLLRVARSPNDLRINCSGGNSGAIASAGIGDYWTTGEEHFSYTDGSLREIYDRRATEGTARAYADVANVTWHETMHQHGYQHLSEGETSGCGYSTYSNWINSAPYIVGRCVRAVLMESRDACGVDECGDGGLMLIDRYRFEADSDSTVGCTCVEDPRKDEIGLIELAGGRLRDLALEGIGDPVAGASGTWNIASDDRVRTTGDFNNDGADDLVITGSQGLMIARYSESLHELVKITRHAYGEWLGGWNLGSADRIVAVGNFYDTAQQELVVQSGWGIGVLRRNSGTGDLESLDLVSYGSSLGTWTLRSTDDIVGVGNFNGGGLDELVIEGATGLAIIERSALSGLRTIRTLVYGTTIGGYSYTSGNSVQAVGDFNGDGTADILLKGTSGLAILSWGTYGLYLLNHYPTDSFAGGWRILSTDYVRAIGDFNDDDRDDILLQRSGTTLGILYRTTSGALTEYARESFYLAPSVRAVGDFEGDGRDDIIVDYSNGGMEILEATSGSMYAIERNPYVDNDPDSTGGWGDTGYFMLGSWPLFQANFFPYTSAMRADKRFRGVGDFDQDGRDDFVIQN